MPGNGACWRCAFGSRTLSYCRRRRAGSRSDPSARPESNGRGESRRGMSLRPQADTAMTVPGAGQAGARGGSRGRSPSTGAARLDRSRVFSSHIPGRRAVAGLQRRASTGAAMLDRPRVFRSHIPGGRAAREPWPACSAGRCLSPNHDPAPVSPAPAKPARGAAHEAVRPPPELQCSTDRACSGPTSLEGEPWPACSAGRSLFPNHCPLTIARRWVGGVRNPVVQYRETQW